MTNTTNKIIENPIETLNAFLKFIGFDDKTIAEHHQRLAKLIFTSIADDLDTLSEFKEKESFPSELKSIDDFFGYYEKYVDKETIKKIVAEKYKKFYSEYIESITKPLGDIDKI